MTTPRLFKVKNLCGGNIPGIPKYDLGYAHTYEKGSYLLLLEDGNETKHGLMFKFLTHRGVVVHSYFTNHKEGDGVLELFGNSLQEVKVKV